MRGVRDRYLREERVKNKKGILNISLLSKVNLLVCDKTLGLGCKYMSVLGGHTSALFKGIQNNCRHNILLVVRSL